MLQSSGLGNLRDTSATETRKAGEAIKTVRLATDLGINYFDTSPLYQLGQSEYFLGLGLKNCLQIFEWNSVSRLNSAPTENGRNSMSATPSCGRSSRV
jgi:predicted aldo/keto reductase-like oxidoreductase